MKSYYKRRMFVTRHRRRDSLSRQSLWYLRRVISYRISPKDDVMRKTK